MYPLGRGTLGTFKTRKTLVVKKIINFTSREMWTYGTSGELIKLSPKIPDASHPEPGIFYVVDDEVKESLTKKNPAFKNQILSPTFKGKGRENKNIYKFTAPLYKDTDIIPITEEYGRCGFICRKWVLSNGYS